MSDNQKDKKSTLINELDSLKHTLNSGPEYQQDIPILDEPYRDTTHHKANDFFDDHDLDIPILTDPFETASPEELSIEIDHITPYMVSGSPENTGVDNTVQPSSTPQPQLLQPRRDHEPNLNEHSPIDLHKLSEETDSSLIELDQVLDELVAEQLPKLEQQLREKLRHELEFDIKTPLVEPQFEPQIEQKIPASKA